MKKESIQSGIMPFRKEPIGLTFFAFLEREKQVTGSYK
jgi:hypothetical protein